MLKCPECGATLTKLDPQTARCPRCGCQIDESKQNNPQATGPDTGAADREESERVADQTIDSVADSPEAPVETHDSSIGSAPVSGFDQTIDSVAESGDGPGETHDSSVGSAPVSGFDQTIDSVAESGDGPGETLDSSIASAGSAGGSGSGSGYDQTIDSSQSGLSSSAGDSALDSEFSVSGLQKVWGMSPALSSPIVSLKSNTSGGDPEQSMSSLTIQPRNIRKPSSSTDLDVTSLDYDLQTEIGKGGMGVVFSARQASLDRHVAVKMLKPDIMSSEGHRRKFISEAVVTGELEHPGIIPIYDMGCSDDGTLFYSMKQVQGIPWSNVIRKHTLSENLEILMKVCDAIAFAHSRDVIHRDIKPENVMLGDFGEVLVLDWGLAATITEDAEKSVNISRVQNMGGTPAYMAPEMATGPLESIGKHSDVYLLGAILYECITGRLPRKAKSATACLMAAAKNRIEPTDKQGELVEIALKAMSADPTDRYESVKALQAAIRDYNDHSESVALSSRAADELTTARQTDDYQDYAKALFGFEEAFDLWSNNHAARSGISVARLAYASSAQRKGDYDLGLSLLEPENTEHDALRNELLVAQRERDARQQRLRTARRIMIGLASLVFLAISVGSVLVWRAKLEAQRNAELAKANADRAEGNERKANRNAQLAERRAREAERQRKKALYESYVALIGLAAVKIDERAFDQAAALLEQCPPPLRNWEWGRLRFLCDLRDGQPPLQPGGQVEGIDFDPGGSLLASINRKGMAQIWEWGKNKPTVSEKMPFAGSAIAFHPQDPQWLAVGGLAAGGGGALLLWNYTTGEQRRLQGHTAEVVDVQFSLRSADLLLTASKDKTARLWNVRTGEQIQVFRGHSSWVWAAAFSPTQKHLIVTASEDGTARLWDARTGQQRLNAKGEPMPFRGHQSAVFTVQFSPDGRSVASGGFDKRILLWDPQEVRAFDFASLLRGEKIREQPFVTFEGHSAAITSLRFSPDGEFLISGSHDNTIRLWTTHKTVLDGEAFPAGHLWKTIRGHSSLIRTIAVAPQDPKFVASGSQDGFIRLWNTRKYAEERYIPDVVIRGHSDAVFMADFAPSGEFVVTASRDRTARIWSQKEGDAEQVLREGHLFLVSKGLYYPRGKRLLTAAGDGSIRVWDAEKTTQEFSLSRTGIMSAVAISRNGRWIASGKEPELDKQHRPAPEQQGVAAAIWDGETGELVHLLRGHAAPVTAVAFSADEKTLFTGDAKGRGILWDVASATPRRLPAWHIGQITAALFLGESGQRLLTAGADKTVGQWSIDSEHAIAIDELTLKHEHGVTSMDATPDGQYLLTGDDGGWLRLWSLDQAKEIWRWRVDAAKSRDGEPVPRSSVTSVAVSPNGEFALAVHASLTDQRPSLRVWELGKSPGQPILQKVFRDRDVWAATFAPTKEAVLVLGGDEATELDLAGKPIRRFSPHRAVAFASYSPDATRIITGGWDSTARVWDSKSGECKRKLDLRKLGGEAFNNDGGGPAIRVNSAVYSPNGDWILTAGNDGVLGLWKTQGETAGKRVARLQESINYANFSSDNRRVLAACQHGAARILDLISGKQLQRFAGHEGEVLHAAFSGDNQRVVTCGEDRLAKIWDAETGELICTLKGHTDAVTWAAFSPDRKRVLTGSRDQTAKLWDVDEELRAEQTEHVAGVSKSESGLKLQTVAQGELLVAASKTPNPTGNRRIGKEILTLRGRHQQAVTSVAFSRDGRSVLTSSLDGTAVIWPAADWRYPENR